LKVIQRRREREELFGTKKGGRAAKLSRALDEVSWDWNVKTYSQVSLHRGGGAGKRSKRKD